MRLKEIVLCDDAQIVPTKTNLPFLPLVESKQRPLLICEGFLVLASFTPRSYVMLMSWDTNPLYFFYL